MIVNADAVNPKGTVCLYNLQLWDALNATHFLSYEILLALDGEMVKHRTWQGCTAAATWRQRRSAFRYPIGNSRWVDFSTGLIWEERRNSKFLG